MHTTVPRSAARLFHLTLAATGNLAAAVRAADITPAEGRRLRDQPPPEGLKLPARPPGSAPGDAQAHRLELAVAALEEEAVRRALHGVSEPVFHQGRECGSKAKHSDALLIFLLKTLRPERYGPATRRPERDGEDEAGEEAEGEGAPPLCVDFAGGVERAEE